MTKLRRDDPQLRRIPPYLSLLAVIGGIVWILLLPLQEYSRRTYISENALLPGQVHTYFGGSEQHIFRAYKHELSTVFQDPHSNETSPPQEARPINDSKSAKIQQLFQSAGLKSARQRYSYTSSGNTYEGENVHAILHAPRGDGTEAIVLLAAMSNIDGVKNVNGVPLLISLARYFKRWSLWSKDIIFLVTPDSTTGPQAWMDAYHSTHDPSHVQAISLKSGAIQGVVCIDYPFEHRFEDLHIAYDGINGALPNLDLFNTAVTIATGQMGIGASIQSQHTYTQKENQGSYPARLQTLVNGMSSQALGHATGPHSSFMSYHIDAITLTAIGKGWQDEMAFGRTVESICRSLNNLLEKLHQSFFFYLLMQTNRFVSIGTYLPSAMAIAASYTIMAIHLWVLSGYKSVSRPITAADTKGKQEKTLLQEAPDSGVAGGSKSSPTFEPIDRQLMLPITLLTAIQLGSLIPLYLLTTLGVSSLPITFTIFSLCTLVLPFIFASIITGSSSNTNTRSLSDPMAEDFVLIKSLSLLVLGLSLTVLATLNFSLSMVLGLICIPLAFVDRTPNRPLLASLQYLVLVILSPGGVAAGLLGYAHIALGKDGLLLEWLARFAFGFNIWGSWGVPVGVLCIWLPAWVINSTVVASTWFV